MPLPSDIENAMTAAGVSNQCPRCGGTEWLGAKEFVNLRLSSDPGGERSSDSLPSIAVVCERCGFVSLHSPMVLGLT